MTSPSRPRTRLRKEERIQKIMDQRAHESAAERKKRLAKKEKKKDREGGRRFESEIADAYDFRLAGIEQRNGRDARVALLKNFNMDMDITYRDYKKLRTDAKIVGGECGNSFKFRVPGLKSSSHKALPLPAIMMRCPQRKMVVCRDSPET